MPFRREYHLYDMQESTIESIIRKHFSSLKHFTQPTDKYESTTFLSKLGDWVLDIKTWFHFALAVVLLIIIGVIIFCLLPKIINCFRYIFHRRPGRQMQISEPILIHAPQHTSRL